MNGTQFVLSCKTLYIKVNEAINIKDFMFFIIKSIIIGIICIMIKLLLTNLFNSYIISLAVVYGIFIISNMLINKRRILYLIKNLK